MVSKDKEAAQKRLELLASLNRTSRTFAETMRLVVEENRRFAGERERLLKREREARTEAEVARKQLYEVLESIGDAFFALDQRWRFTYVNDRAVRLAGRPREELLGKSAVEAFPELLGDAASAELVRTKEKGTAAQFEHYSPRLDRWLHYRVYPSPTGFSVYITDITERKKAEKDRERLLTRESVARAEAAERRRISRELHDRVAHSMGVVHQSLQLYKALLARDPSQAEAKLTLAQEMAKAALDSTRNLAMELRNQVTEGELEGLLSNLFETSVPPDVEAKLSVEGDESSVPSYVREQLFLILREAVRNAVSHSGCDRLSVHLDIIPEKVIGTVEEDGCGFDPEEPANGAGLKSMKERAALLRGTCSVRSEPNVGTRVQISIPLTQER